MNKTELIAAVAEKAEISKKDAEKAVKAFTDVVSEELVNGGKIQLVGFGTFEVSERPAREGPFFAVPDGKHNVGMVYHIIVTHEHKMQCGRQADALTKEDLCRIPAHEECIAIAH